MTTFTITGRFPVRVRLEQDWYLKPLCLLGFVIWAFSLPLFGNRQVMAAGRHITATRAILPYVEIPFDYYRRQILVTGEVNSTRNLTFVLDTGATMAVIDSGVGAQGNSIGQTRIQAVSGESSAEIRRVETLRVTGPAGAAVVKHDVPLLVADLRRLQRIFGRRIDGILGIGFLANYVTQIDYDKHALRFYDPTLYGVDGYAPDNQRSFLFDLVPSSAVDLQPCMLVSGRLRGGYLYSFLLDTGFGGYLSVTRTAAQESGLCAASGGAARGISYTLTASVSSEQMPASELSLGTMDLSGKQISVDDRMDGAWGSCGIVGNGLLEDYRVTIDYPRHKLWLVRAGDEMQAENQPAAQ